MKISHNLIFKYIRDEYYPPVSLTLEWFFDGSFAIHCGSIRELSCVFHWQGIYSTVVVHTYSILTGLRLYAAAPLYTVLL